MRSMPTRPSAALSKHAARPPGASHPPAPGWPAGLRWSASVALALGLPVLLALAAQRLGPGPHATLRIELALQPLGRGMGPGGSRAGSSADAGAGSASGQRPAALPVSPQPTATVSLLPALPGEPAVPPAPAPAPDPRAATPAVTVSTTVSVTALAPTPEQPPVAARPPPPVPRKQLDVVQPAPGPAARTAAAGSWSAAGTSATERRGRVPGDQAEDGAETGTGRGAGTVRPEALDAGFGLAAPVRLAYPAEALAHGQGGRARIEVEIEPDGRVARVTVLEETGEWGFGAAARQAYARARFTEPRMAGSAVRVVLRKTIEFEP